MGLDPVTDQFSQFLRLAFLRSPNFVTGVSGWTINQDGSAEFNNVVIRNGQIVSGTALFYSGPPAPGNLVAAISGTAGTDLHGNAFGEGFTLDAGMLTGASSVFMTSGVSGIGGDVAMGQLMQSKALTIGGANPQIAFAAGTPVPSTSALVEIKGPGNPASLAIVETAAGAALAIQRSADTTPRLQSDDSGKLQWGPGNAAPDTNLSRSAVSTLHTDDAFDISTAQVFALRVTETTAAPASPPVQLIGAGAGDRALGVEVTGDTSFRLRMDTNGRLDWGPGNAATDVALLRAALGVLAATGNLVIGAAAETTTAALEVQGGPVALATHAAPATPPAGFGFAYVNSADLFPHYKAASGSDLTIPGGSGDNTSITVTAAAATRISRNWNIAANDVNAAGTTYRITVWGNGTEGSTAQNLTFSIWLDGVAVQSVTAAALPLNAPFRWKVEILLTVATVGAGGNGNVNLSGHWGSTASPTVENSFTCGSASSTGQGFNTTILHTLALAVAWASTTGAPTITGISSTFERIGP